MKFIHRFGYYMLGFLIGGVFLLFIFQNKRTEFCYMPNCRVLKSIRAKGIVVSKEAQAVFDQKTITLDDVKNSLDNGDVDFSRSNKPNKEGGKIYIIEGNTSKNEPIELEIINYSDKAILKGLKKV